MHRTKFIRVALALALALCTSATALPDVPVEFEDRPVIEGIESPASFDFDPDGRLFFTERILGHLRIARLDRVTGTWVVQPDPYFTFDVPRSNGAPAAHRSSGVRGFAFDPDFRSNGYVYVFYMKDNPRQNRVVRIRQNPANPNVAEPLSETLLLELPFNSSSASGSHNGGALRFGADDMLYITTGDGWSGGDSVQSLSTFTGKVLRIRADGSIPSSNPFYGQATGAYRAIYALGLRNPYTMSLNPDNGWLTIGEANGDNKARIHVVTPGANFGHQGYGGIGVQRGTWVDASNAGGKMITGGAWYPQGGSFPARYHGAYFVALWGLNGANGGPPGDIDYVTSATDTSVQAFGHDIGIVDPNGTRLKPVHVRVGPRDDLFYLLTSYETGAGAIRRIQYTGQPGPEPPSILPVGGTYADPVTIAMHSPTPGCAIRYTTDGSAPTAASSLYAAPILVSETELVRARSFHARLGESEIAEEYFVIGDPGNEPPVASAGPDQDAVVQQLVVLNGAGSYDPDGSNLFLSETWTQVGGPHVQLSNADEAAAFFVPNVVGRYVFRISVTDGIDADTDQTVVDVLPCVNDFRDELVARWSFEEAAGEIALDSAAGLWNGWLAGAAWSTSTSAARSRTLDFDGANAAVHVGPIDISGEALTISAWIHPDDFDVADARIVSKANGVSESEHTWMLSTIQSSGSPRLRFRVAAGGHTSTLVATSGDLQAGRWSFVAAVYDGTSMRLYLDGILVGERSKTGSLMTDPTRLAAIGNQPPAAGMRAFDGSIDEVRLYSKALTSAELLVLAGRTRRADCDSERSAVR